MKKRFRGEFNWCKELYVFYSFATNEHDAWLSMTFKLCSIVDRAIAQVRGEFNGEKDNYKIIEL